MKKREKTEFQQHKSRMAKLEYKLKKAEENRLKRRRGK